MRLVQVNISYFSPLLIIVSLFGSGPSAAQELTVVRNYRDYQKLAEKDSLHKMVNLRERIPSLQIHLVYATKENFTGKKLYPKGDETFVRLAVVTALGQVATELATKGYGLKVWDAYRPYSATKEMWDLIRDERYVANPAKGSNHNRGLAIDLTLTKDGKEVQMGTGFDHFSDSAHHAFNDLPEEVLAHRKLLKSSMEKYGFKALDTEWWHYSWPNDRQYQVLDISFKKLKTSLQ
jgi:zinc D-Ala-D-Ala dipeptidase